MGDISQEQEVNVNPTDQPPGSGGNLSLSEIAALRDRIEQQKANKLKAEQLVSTLSKIKAREKASRRSTKSGEKTEDGSNQPIKRSGTNTSNALKEKSNLLKKKLEEDRARFESKKGQEDLGKVSEIVEHLRVQLEGQDKTIQQIHSNFAATTKVPQPVEQIVQVQPDIPPEVKQRIADLEMKILDLQENLREKDSVISARTQAITLLSEDMARKGKNTLDNLEETRIQMKTMQANFVALEDRMNEERTRLREEVEAKKLRLQQIEKNYRAAESARFDLSTRVAELQEKVVALQTRNLTLEEEVTDMSAKTKELQDNLESSNKQTVKLKAQFKAKLKALEEERDMLRKDKRANEELTRLRERIADLEDEKGNLQLHLVDFDEIQEAGHLLKERISEMEEKLHRQECDLDSHIKAITSLEAEKLDLIEATTKKNAALKEKEDMLQALQAQLSEMEGTKIAAEMKCLELEERLDAYIKSESDGAKWNAEFDKIKLKLHEYQETINELTTKLESKERGLKASGQEDGDEQKGLKDTSALLEWQNKYSLLEEKLNCTLAYCEELEAEKKEIENKNEELLNECSRLKDTVEKLNSVLNAKSQSSEQQQVDELRQTLAQKDIEIININKHNKALESEVDNLRHTLQATTLQLHSLSQQVEELTCTRQKVEELNAVLDNKDKELDERSRKLSDYKKFHKLKSEDVLRISHELDSVSTSSQQRISELETALSDAQQIEESLRKEITELKESINKGPESLDTKLQEQSLKMKKLAANLKLKTKLVKDFETKIEEFEKALQQKDIVISSLENEKANLQKQLVEHYNVGSEHHPNTAELEETCRVLETEVNTLKEELKSKTEEIECLKSTSSEKYENVVQIKELENENKKLNDISESKSDQLKKMEDEISDLSGLNKSLLHELEQMQESYKQDALKNESVLDSFEHEMLGNKKDILELSNQLKDVTGKYEQAWIKLQEKEGYIEDLEQQLERVKLRLLQIESTVEERRRSLEEKAELLGARLNQAEMNNEQLERHEGELEQKIAFLLNTEEMLGNVLERLQEENTEMSKSLSESADKNIKLAQELECEHSKVQSLTKEINDLRTNLANYEKLSEDYETVKTQLKEVQEVRDSQVRYLENRLTESEQCMDSEIRRLLDKVNVVETERQEVLEKFNALLVEKQILEEEMASLQETIADIRREELEELRNNHIKLEEQLNKELEKREEHISRIHELESQLLKQNLNPELSSRLQGQEVLALKEQLQKECKEKETLQYELLTEKAKKQIDDVVCKAEETFFTMSAPFTSSFNLKSVPAGSSSDPFSIEEMAKNKPTHVNQLNELENKLSTLSSENAKLKARLQELECQGQTKSEASGGQSESDDWAAVSKDDDDGWGWGSKDAMLEHEYIQKQKLNSELEAKVVEMENKLSIANEENKKLNEELKSAQTKCSKLFKKLKEFKNKSDSLERSSREKSVGFDDLDFAMQEELKSQIERLEKNLKECNANSNLLQQEREGLLKRIDVLTSGNERLIEMKERQDIEVEMWQKRISELQNTVQGLEWTIAELHAEQNYSTDIEGDSSFSAEEKKQFLSNALEMEEKLNVLAAENDYLQSLIVDLKDRDKKSALPSLMPVKEENKNQQEIDNNKYLQLQQENVRLNDVIQSLEDKLKLEGKSTNENVIEYTHRIESLMKENEWLSSSIEKLKAKSDSDFHVHDEFKAANEKYSALKSENEYLSSSVSELNTKLEELQTKFDIVQTERNNYEVIIKQLEEGKENINIQDEAVNSHGLDPHESPTLFRGFTSFSDDTFEVDTDNMTSIFDTKTTAQTPGTDIVKPSSADFFDTIKRETEFATAGKEDAQQINTVSHLSSENTAVPEAFKSEENLMELNKVKTTLALRESDINSLREALTRLEEENNELRRTIADKPYANSVAWSPITGMSSDKGSGDRSLHWGEELNLLRKQVEDKDCTISSLMEQLNQKTSLFGDEKAQLSGESPVGNDNFNDIFSRSEDDHESQINYFVEQITQLTKTVHDKEVEIQTLSDKKKKYKEMYHSLAKEHATHSSDLSNSDKEHLADQNVMLNQLLDDKETELEIMSQQIEQSIVAKENLQDELTLMEAANNSFAIPAIQKEIFLPQSQPENIEEVRTLCAEVAELTKLLQEKESEVEILKQQIDESNLEKENLLDEWKKELDRYKEMYNNEAAKAQQLEDEMERFKDEIMSDIKKQYKDDLYLKDQQLMNAMNDLRNTHSFYRDSETKMEALESSLQNCTAQNNQLVKELNNIQNVHSALQAIVGYNGNGNEMSLIEKVQKLKDDLKELEVKIEQTKVDIEERDKIIFDLRERVKCSEINVISSETVITEQPISPVQTKTFASEPFRISTEQSSSDDDSSSKHMETIHAQMMMKEIQSLKQVLAMKDTEITRLSIALNDAQESIIRGEMRFINSEEESLRQRLDEALYTLHLRDVRCDELALELMQLLEERDSLQLRLSTAIRFNEELRQKSKLLDDASAPMEGAAGSSSDGIEDNGSDKQLKQKLDQLHNVGYRRDPGLQQDQHRRHQEQMQLYSQVTTAQDDSHLSAGFFNWIFGASSSGSQDV